MRRSVGMVVLLLAMLGMMARPVCGQEAGVGTIEADAREIAASVERAERMREGGTGAESLSAGQLLAEQVSEAMAGVGGGRGKVFRQGFLITVPEVEECRAVTEAGEAIPVYPLLPMGGQGAAVGEGDGPVEMEVVYGGMGRLEDLRGRDLRGRLVALEMNAREGSVAWQRAAALGAGAILFLGDERTENRWFLEKETTVPLGIPRLYCDDAAWVARLRGGGENGVKRVSLRVRVAWRERALENVVAVLPPASGRGGGAGGTGADHWVIVQSRYDGASQVMAGAARNGIGTDAMNAAILMDLAKAVGQAPARCGVVLVWTAGDAWNLRGTREFLDLVGRPSRDAARLPETLRQRAASARQAAEDAQAVAQGVAAVGQAAAGGDWPAVLKVGAGGRNGVEEELLRRASQVEQALQKGRLAKDGAEVERLRRDKQDLLTAVAVIAGKVEGTGETSAGAGVLAAVKAAAERALPVWQRDVARREREALLLVNWGDIRQAMPPRDPLLLVSLGLYGGRESGTTAGRAVGLAARSAYSEALDATGRITPFAQAFRRYAENIQGSAGGVRFEAESLENRFSAEAFFPMNRAYGSDAAIARGLPAMAFTSLYDRCAFLDTPRDQPENIDWPAAEAQARILKYLLLGGASPGALTDPQLYGRTLLDVQVSDQQVTLFERAIGETLPRLKAAEALIGGESEIRRPLGPPLAGTRRTDWYLTHADGTAVFRSAGLRSIEAEVRLQAYRFDELGRVRQALLANQSEIRGMVANFLPRADVPVRAMLFDCRRLDAVGLFDPRHLDVLQQLQVLDARRQDEAQSFNIYARGGVAAVFLPREEDIRWQLLGSAGAIGNRMILVNADAENPRGQGFVSVELAELGPLNWRAARDFFWLDDRRKRDLEKFGISNEVIRELHAGSEKQLALAEAAFERRDYPAAWGAADALWSLQSQEYQNLIQTSNSIIRGVIFLLLGVIPFSYFLERLLIGSPKVYRQIAWFGGIFVVMTAGLWFHPAFRISSTPLMILLAFFILILSSTVVYILFGKFEEEIARLREGGEGGGRAGHVASFQRSAVLGAAIRLGLSNMRRRGMRTALTLVTLVLLTFTLLCFTSVRESVQVSPQPIRWTGAAADAPPPPAGILLRQREWTALPAYARQWARNLALPPAVVLGDTTAEAHEQGVVAGRWWYSSQRPEQAWVLPVQKGGRRGDRAALGSDVPARSRYPLSGLVGLEAGETEFQGAGRDGGLGSLLEGYEQLRDVPGETAICWLPDKARETLGVGAGDEVLIAGYALRIAGFFDAAEFAKLRHLSGEPMAPAEPHTGARQAGSSGRLGGAMGGSGSENRFLDPLGVAIVPGWMVEALGGRLTSIMVRPAGIGRVPTREQAAELHAVAVVLARRSAFGVYVSDGAGNIQIINAAEAARPQDLGTVLVPLLIAGVIVLNTMLGAVSERTREIHVYTSVGLSPAHVGMLFLAEAAALGTLGVVFGYIFGQGLATVLSWTRILPGVDLNYSSMSAIVTMGLVLGLVMLSALWPARAATRLAAPSLQRDWKLPRPVGDVLAVDLPFTVNETAARGVCAFVAEYLVSTSHAGTGRFTADGVVGTLHQGTQGPVRAIEARIWLAPYDLGVIQGMRLSIHPSDQAGVFDVHIRLEREAGNPGTWRRLNRPFLVEIRKQFLLWRALDTRRVGEYVAKSDELFTSASGEGGA